MQAAPPQPETDATPDFVRGVFIADKPGTEFASMRTARIAAPTMGGQLPLAAMGGAGILFVLLRHAFGLSPGWSLAVSIPVGIVALVFATAMTQRLVGGQRHGTAWTTFSARSTDTRFRLRVVIPGARRTNRLAAWATDLAGFEPEPNPESSDLDATRGGFEPVIVRPWLGVTRDGPYRIVTVGAGMVALGAIVLAGAFYIGWMSLFNTFSIWGAMAIVAGFAWFAAENAYPVYLRLAPGRLDLFRYPLLGIGDPNVTTVDLRTTPLCVDFGSYTVAIEPPRPPGEPAPALVLSKQWPHFQQHPPEGRPWYVSVALCPRRSEFCRRLVQAARTDEPTPPLPDDRLIG